MGSGTIPPRLNDRGSYGQRQALSRSRRYRYSKPAVAFTGAEQKISLVPGPGIFESENDSQIPRPLQLYVESAQLCRNRECIKGASACRHTLGIWINTPGDRRRAKQFLRSRALAAIPNSSC